MDYGGCDKRKTKKDLKRKGIAGRYKRGGQFRTTELDTSSKEDPKDKKSKKK